MAGIEQLEIHSKSYMVRWINVSGGHTISWSLQPHKKSINFGIFKHPGTPNGQTPVLSTNTTLEDPPPSNGTSAQATSVPTTRPRRKSSASSTRVDTAGVTERLEKLGIKSVSSVGKCEADKVSIGDYHVPEGQSGMYGLVFDNTHSKQFSKAVTFVLITYPTNAPPKSGHHSHFSQAMTRKSSNQSSGHSPSLPPLIDTNDSVPQDIIAHRSIMAATRPRSGSNATEYGTARGTSFYTGVLSKKGRRRNQGYARRFFSLDFTSSTLSYYKNRNSSALRGSVPLALAAIGANEKDKHISVDSGAEIWLLRAHSQKEFDGWKDALERAAHSAATPMSPNTATSNAVQSRHLDLVDHREWETVETLVGRVAGITDAVRRLANDTNPNSSSCLAGLGITTSNSNGIPSPFETNATDYFDGKDIGKRPFWKRSPSSGGQSPSGIFRRSISAQRVPGNTLKIPSPANGPSKGIIGQQPHEGHVHDHCRALLRDLDAVVAEFSSLLAEGRQRRAPERPGPTARNSIDSTQSQEFFDADDGLRPISGLLTIHRDSGRDDENADRDNGSAADDSASTSDIDIDDFNHIPQQGQFPSKPKSLSPLPLQHIERRTTIPPSSGAPPSLISFLRKNVGKDLSTIAMPVTANEPLSLLQRQAEALEYSELLDSACAVSSANSAERLLYVTAFAISSLSNSRMKERAIRKPFNPMLGETFELVREDKGFRLLAEKISHRPVQVACQAEAKGWTFTCTVTPSQKFWGKSAELVTEGRARVVLHATNDCYSWTPPTCFLRNILAGDKYVEPVGSMTVSNETSGTKAVVTFKAGGMFSGRSEDVTVQAFDAQGELLPLGLQGKWTDHLILVTTTNGHDQTHHAAEPGNREIWKVGPMLPNAPTRYGMTAFAAQLNEITEMEKGALPPTDSRLRPDQRKYEEGTVNEAEALKAMLEDGQRRRRKEMEEGNQVWEARWFRKVEGGEQREEAWYLKSREGEGYWDVRKAVLDLKGGKWDGVREVFEV